MSIVKSSVDIRHQKKLVSDMSTAEKLKQSKRRKKRLEKYRYVLRRPQKSFKPWTPKEVERLIQNKMVSRCSRREDQCRQAIIAFGGSAKGGISWKEFRNAVIKKLLIPVSVEQVKSLWEKYDKNGAGRISFHTLMANLMPLDYDIPTDKAVLDMKGTLFGYEVVDKNRAPKIFHVTHKWPVKKLFKKMRQTLILRGGGLPVAMKHYSMQNGRNNNSGMFVSKQDFQDIVTRKFNVPASAAECEALFEKFDAEKKGVIKFSDMFMQLDLGRFLGTAQETGSDRKKRVVRGPADWDPSAANTRDLKRNPIPLYQRKYLNDDDIGSMLSTSSWGTVSTNSTIARESNRQNTYRSTVSTQSKISVGKRIKGRPKSASSTRSRLEMQTSKSHSVVSKQSYKKYPHNTIDGDDLESELGDSASIVAERLSKSRSESCLSSSSYSVKSIKTKKTLKKIPTRSELLKTEEKLNKKTIMAAIAAASHYRAIRELAHRKRPMSALTLRRSLNMTGGLERPRERGLALYLNGS